MTKLIAVKCPQCGADLQIEEGRKTAYCTYCGAKVLIENENEYIYRHIDDAEIKKAEAEERIRMRELDLEEEEARSGKKKAAFWAAAVIACIAIMTIGGLAGQDMIAATFMVIAMWVAIGAYTSLNKEKAERQERKERSAGKIKMPVQISGEGQYYESLERMLRHAGFNNITCMNLQDLTFGILKKPGTVAEVTIDGEDVMRGKWYYPDAYIVISYHGR